MARLAIARSSKDKAASDRGAGGAEDAAVKGEGETDTLLYP
jgi:hypothetical protein